MPSPLTVNEFLAYSLMSLLVPFWVGAVPPSFFSATKEYPFASRVNPVVVFVMLNCVKSITTALVAALMSASIQSIE